MNKVLGYDNLGNIQVIIDDVEWSIPSNGSHPFQQIVDEWEAQGNVIPPYIPPPEPPYKLYKSTFINRMDEEIEAVVMEAVLAAAPAKMRMLFNSVEYFVSDDPLFIELHAAIAATLGTERADQLLAKDDAQ